MTTEMLVYVGTYTKSIRFGSGRILEGKGEGIYLYRMHPATGALEFDSKTTGVVNPSYLAVHQTHRFLYAVNELKSYEDKPTGMVSAFGVDSKSGKLAFLNRRVTHGTDPCHVVVDGKGRYIFVANFMSGSVCVLGRLSMEQKAAYDRDPGVGEGNLRPRPSYRRFGVIQPDEPRRARRAAGGPRDERPAAPPSHPARRRRH